MLLLFVLVTTPACIVVDAEPVDTQTRSFEQTLPLSQGETLRLANLAGKVEFIGAPEGSEQVHIEATVHAHTDDDDETRRLLDSMTWVESEDRDGRPEWALSYPVEDYDTFHYQREGSFSWGWSTTSSYRGEPVKVRGTKGGAPTLWVDLRITVPSGARLALRNLSGRITGGDLRGALEVDTGDGDVEFDSFEGDLIVDTGSGDVTLGTVRGHIQVDTGSGVIQASELIGQAVLDTGSGDVRVEQVAVGLLEIDTGSGSVVVRQGNAGDLRIDTGSGDVIVDDVDMILGLIDTGSGDVRIDSALAQTERLSIDTGSGDVRIRGGEDASFALEANMRRREIDVGYRDAEVVEGRGTRVVRGDGRAVIQVRTGSGSCSIRPG